MSCAACGTAILLDEDSLQCTLKECRKMYHLLCIGENKLLDSAPSWTCPECRCAAKRGGDNSHTPVGVSKKTRDPNVTYRLKIPAPEPEEVHQIGQIDLSSDIRSLREEISALKVQLGLALNTIMTYETKLQCYATHVQALHDKIMESEIRLPHDARDSATATLRPHSLVESTPAPSIEKPPIQSQEKPPVKQKKQEIPPSKRAVAPKALSEVLKAPMVAIKSTAPISSSSSSSASPPSEAVTEHQQWTEVKKKSHRPTSLCGTAGPAVTSLKAVEARAYIHLWNMASPAADVLSYLRELCPQGECTIEELTPKGDYKSFKLGVPAASSEKCMSTDVWPVNARIKTWINYRQRRAPLSQPRRSQSFRGPVPS